MNLFWEQSVTNCFVTPQETSVQRSDSRCSKIFKKKVQLRKVALIVYLKAKICVTLKYFQTEMPGRHLKKHLYFCGEPLSNTHLYCTIFSILGSALWIHEKIAPRPMIIIGAFLPNWQFQVELSRGFQRYTIAETKGFE